jgi:hypothetical protein
MNQRDRERSRERSRAYRVRHADRVKASLKRQNDKRRGPRIDLVRIERIVLDIERASGLSFEEYVRETEPSTEFEESRINTE